MKFLESTLNTRTIIQNSLQYIRSDVPNNLTDEEVDWLIYNNICTIVDLREDYMKTKENFADALENFAKQCPEVDINVITPSERYMREFLGWLKER